MSIRIEQGFFDRREALDGDGLMTSAEVPYFVFNAEDETSAINAVFTGAANKIGRLYLAGAELDERINESTFKVLALYEQNEAKDRESTTGESGEDEPGFGNSDPAVAFDTTGGTRHINQSINTVSITPADAPNYNGAIEVDGEGNVNGCDLVMPLMSFSETHFFKPSKVTEDYRKKLSALTAKVNNDNFRGFSPGEVLFTGVSGRRVGTDPEDLWELTFNFSASPNVTNLTVGNGIVVSEKKGWDYLWVKYGEKVVSGAVVKVPVAAYVERVYEAISFSDLEINAKAVE